MNMGTKQRNYGVDFARLAGMFMVVLLHNLSHGGILDWHMGSKRAIAYFLLENTSIIAVNVFGLISGYLSAGKDVKFRRVLSLWEAAAFWSLMIAAVGILKDGLPPLSLLPAAFPVLTKEYWYLNSFLVLQIVVPFLNAGVRLIKPKRHAFLSAVLITSCSVLGSLGGLGLNNGYSPMWLTVLWITGAAIKRNEVDVRRISSKVLVLIATATPVVTTFIEWAKSNALGEDPAVMIAYVNPLVTLYSLAFFTLCLRFVITSPRIQKPLQILSPLAFGVYLIDQSNWFFDCWLTDRFAPLRQVSAYIGIPAVLFISLTMFLFFLLFEYLRQRLCTPMTKYFVRRFPQS